MTTHIGIIGAGPAGMSAAIRLVEAGCRVTILDEQPSPGGQIYRNASIASDPLITLLGDDYETGVRLSRKFLKITEHEHCRYIPNASVWSVNPDGIVSWIVDEQVEAFGFDGLIIGNGALERPMPLKGWTLPGVMTVGAAQILLKTSETPLRDTVLVGAGPLLYLVAVQLIRSGFPPTAIVETQSLTDLIKASRHLWRMNTKTLAYLVKGLEFISVIKKAGVRRYTGVKRIEIDKVADHLRISFKDGSRLRWVESEYALLHSGVVPNTQITRSLDIDHRWNPGNQSFDPVTNQFGSAKSAVSKNIWLAGDGAKILGADAAIISGKIVAEDVLDKFSFASFDPTRRKNLLKQKDRFGPVRQFLDECYRPSTEILDPDGDVIVCRCEEVKAVDVRKAIALGAQGPNQLKVFTRCGMGNCQGRYCGLTVSQMVASARDMELDEVGYYRIRTPLKPITLKELSTYHE